jgi:hypothetical protein
MRCFFGEVLLIIIGDAATSDDVVLQLCAAARGFEVRQIG